MKKLAIVFIILVMSSQLNAQIDVEKELSNRYSPNEIVSISPNVTFDQAVIMLSKVSEFVSGKTIMSEVSITTPIGIEISGMPYLKALNTITNLMNLIYEEEDNRIVIKRKTKIEKKELDEDNFADLDSKEIEISAIFFEADLQSSVERGIDWKWLLSKSGRRYSSDFRTKSEFGESNVQAATPPGLDINITHEFEIGDYLGNATALFRFFENQNLGEIIASPSISVRDKQKGRIQIGSDFSIKQRDFSGNIVERFYSAGSIIEVTPYIYSKNGIDYVLLKLDVERSTFFPGELTTEIKKTSANTEILLLDGEEAVIGGLYVNEEEIVRNGIPFLKDLPWWVFGLRYITGSDQTVEKRKEIVILIKAEILPSLEERFLSIPETSNILRERIKSDQEKLRNYIQNFHN